MFTKLQKYHKAFLYFVTALIAVSFGMGGVIFALLDPSNRQIVGSFSKGNVEISKREFNTSWENWQQFFELAKVLSYKSLKIQQIRKDANPEEYRQLLYAKNPIWDAIYSLREDVAKLDQKYNEQIGDPNIWKWIARGYIDPMRIEAAFYQELSEQERADAQRKLVRSDAWTLLMLLQKSKDLGIVVSDDEVKEFIANTRKSYPGGPQVFAERLANLKVTAVALEETVKNTLSILKYLNARTANIKVSTESIYKQYAEWNTQYSFQWLNISYKNFLVQNDADYLKERLAFYDEMNKKNPNYFKIPAVATFDYVGLSAKSLEIQVQISEDEINKEFYTKHKDDDLDETNPKVAQKVQEEKKEIERKLRTERANTKALNMVRDVQEKIVNLGESAALEMIAANCNLEYKNWQDVSEDQFSKQAEFQGQTKDMVYLTLKPGQISAVIDANDSEEYKKYFFLRLNKRVESSLPTKEELEKNELLFLERFYINEINKFKTNETYNIGYVIADYETIAKNLIVTNKEKMDFYEKYKGQLYTVEIKNETGKVETTYRKFEEVESDITPKLQRLLAIQELQKLHEIHRFCKEKGKDFQLETAVKEIAQQIMLVPESIRYIESTAKNLEEVQRSNPAGDDEIFRLVEDGNLSDVKNTEQGKYFYKVLVHEKNENQEFAKIREQVKETFLKTRAMKVAEGALKEWHELYQQQYQDIRTEIEQNYDQKIKVLWQARDSANESDKQKITAQSDLLAQEKKARLESVSNDLFKTLAVQKGVSITTSNFLTEEEMYRAKEFRALSNNFGQLTALEVGGITNPIVSESAGELFLAQLIAKKLPILSEIPESDITRIRNMMWQRNYQSHLMGFLTHKTLAEEMGFKDHEYIDNEDVDHETPSNLPMPISEDIGD